jgi:hypothetical protein
VDSFDVERWWQDRAGLVSSIPRKIERQDRVGHLHNPYAGRLYAWQLTETVDDFLVRLPPETTPLADGVPWIYICNPFIPRREKVSSESQSVQGCEDEGPEDDESQVLLFKEGGMERLGILSDYIQNARSSRKAKPAIVHDINKERDDAVRDILALAYTLRVRCGKWMLFIEPSYVNKVWEIVARATANNELGIAAKVAPKNEGEPNRVRLICIYTKDFRDKNDIGRVLKRLKELGLVKMSGRQIYYKCGRDSVLCEMLLCLRNDRCVHLSGTWEWE